MDIFNQVVITGKVAKAPNRLYRPDGTSVIQFPLELDDSKDFSERKDMSLIPIVATGELAKSNTSVDKGQHLLVRGRLHQRRWQTKEGRIKTITEVIAIELKPFEK